MTIDLKGSSKGGTSSKGKDPKGSLPQEGEGKDPKGALTQGDKRKDPAGSQPPSGDKRDPKGSQMDPREITHKDPIEVITPLEGLFAIKMGSMIGTPEPSMMTSGKGQKRDASSDLENTIAKQLCLDEEILTPGDFGLSPIATPEGSSGKVRIPQEGSYVDLGEEDFTEVTKRNRKTHGTKNAAAFEEPIKDTHSPTPTGTRTWAHEPIQYVYVLYTFTKNMGEAKLQDFAKGLAKHVGGFQSAYAPVQDQGPFFKMENSKAQKACKYEHPGIDIKYVSITKEKPENKPKKNDNEAGNTKSYAILRLGLNSPIDTLKKFLTSRKIKS